MVFQNKSGIFSNLTVQVFEVYEFIGINNIILNNNTKTFDIVLNDIKY